MNGTPRLSLPFLSAGQAQKEFTHNEALQTLDIVCAAMVEEEATASPPAAPVIGSCYLVGSSATGEWSGKTDCLTGFTSGGWRFVAPLEGMNVYVKSSGSFATFRSGAWELGNLRGSVVVLDGQQVVGSRSAAISSPAGGASTDIEARTAIDQILAALRHHGLIDA